MKETKIHSLWVTKYAIMEKKCFYALNIDVGGQ